MAVLTKKPIKSAGTISGNQPQIRVYNPDSGVELYGGDLVKKAGAADGDFVRAANPVAADDLLYGMLIHDVKQGTDWHLGSGAVNTRGGGTFGGTFAGGTADLLGSLEGIGGHVVLANADNIFEISEAAALALSLIGLSAQVDRDTTGDDANVWTSDKDGATKSALIVAVPNIPGQALADTFARVWVIFLGAASAIY